jgi:hypothetical protein
MSRLIWNLPFVSFITCDLTHHEDVSSSSGLRKKLAPNPKPGSTAPLPEFSSHGLFHVIMAILQSASIFSYSIKQYRFRLTRISMKSYRELKGISMDPMNHVLLDRAGQDWC